MPLPNKTLHRLVERFICLIRAPKDENGAVVNDVPVARQSRPDRRAQREENESLCPCQKNQFRKRLVLFFASFSGMSWKQTLEKYTHTVYTYLYGAYDAKDYI